MAIFKKTGLIIQLNFIVERNSSSNGNNKESVPQDGYW